MIVPLGQNKMNISPLWNYLHDPLKKKLGFSTLPIFNLYVTIFFYKDMTSIITKKKLLYLTV